MIRFFSVLVAFCLASTIQADQPNRAPDDTIVKVFVLAGQSNMQGQGVVDLDDAKNYNGGKGTLNHLLADQKRLAKFSHLKQGDDWALRDDVWVRYKTNSTTKLGGLTIGFTGYDGKHHFGPELQFGHILGDFFEEPVLLIKTAWGGKSLVKDFRPPSAVKSAGGQVGPCYKQMLAEVNEALQQAATDFPQLADAEFEISGFVWQQGWNDMVDQTASQQYEENLIHLVNDLRATWNTPNLPVVIGELGNGGKKNVSKQMKVFRRVQSAVVAHEPFVGTVAFAPTVDFARAKEDSPNVGHGHHWFGNAESYLLIGEALGQSMIQLLSQDFQHRVLIIGDSISMGYTPFVRQQLGQQVFVARPMNNHVNAENCQGTKHGVKNIDRWLSIGSGKWDVIHFNFGLHDLKHVDPNTNKNSNHANHPEQSPPEEYEKQLREIVKKLKATGARLVFATTTPVPTGGVRPFRDPNAPKQYNEIAVKVMRDNGIEVNDLYAFSNQRLSEIQQPVNVHFTKDGSQQLGQQVSTAIRKLLEKQ